MKGQMFLIMAIITIMVLIILKISLGLTGIIENKVFLESGLEKQQFKNFRTELIRAVEMAKYQNVNLTRNPEDFLKFARNSLKAEAVDANALFVASSYPNVTANTNTILNVSVLNLLGIEIQELNLTFNSSLKNFTSVENGKTIETNFTFDTSSNYNYTLSVYYLTSYENKTENISITVEIGKSKFIGFFDLRVISSRIEQKDKFTQTYTLS